MNKEIKTQSIIFSLFFLIGCAQTPKKETFNILSLESEIRTFIPPKNSEYQEVISKVDHNKKYKKILTLKEILNLALLNNPDIQSSAWRIRSNEALKDQANLSINPELELEYTNADEDESEITLSQEFEIGGKRSSRVNVAKKELDASRFDFEVKRLSLIEDVKKLYYEIYTIQSRIKLFEETVQLAEKVLSFTKKRVTSGASPKVEVTRAQLALFAANIRFNNSKRKLITKLTSLAGLWGEFKFNSFRIDPKISIPKSLPELSALREKIKNNPTLSKMKIMKERQLSVISLEKANRIPNLTFGATYAQNHESNDNSVALSVSFPLPLFDRNQGNIASSMIGKNLVRLDYERTYNELNLKLYDSYNQMKNSFEEIKVIKKLMLPNSLNAFKDIEHLYKKGRDSYLSLSEAQKNLTEVKISLIDSISSFYIEMAEIESLIGESITNINLKRI